MNKLLLSCLLTCLAPLAHAQFSGSFAPGQFTLIDTNSNGSIVFAGIDTMTITGTDGMGGYGVNLAAVRIAATGTINITYEVTQIDGAGPGGHYDEFGYQLNGVYTPVEYDLGIGGASIPVSANDSFAFYVSSTDNAAGGLNIFVYGFSFSPATPLPLDLISFTGTNAGDINKLEWKTANERQVRSFIIERSTDASTFKAVGSIAATNSASGEYAFADASADSRNYYRLRIVDLDNSFRYGPIVRIDGAPGIDMEIACSPMPFTDELNVAFTAEGPQDVCVALYDISGRLQVQEVQQAAGGRQTVRLSGLRHLPSGIYQLHVSSGNRILAQQKIIRR
jgi:hypothetical protein